MTSLILSINILSIFAKTLIFDCTKSQCVYEINFSCNACYFDYDECLSLMHYKNLFSQIKTIDVNLENNTIKFIGKSDANLQHISAKNFFITEDEKCIILHSVSFSYTHDELILLFILLGLFAFMFILYYYDKWKQKQMNDSIYEAFIISSDVLIDDKCSICLMDFILNEKNICMTPCRHYFHLNCFKSMLEYDDRCAMCRSIIHHRMR
jgi:hypothetical protein